jgi:predicted ArsR family transcriptional regulator
MSGTPGTPHGDGPGIPPERATVRDAGALAALGDPARRKLYDYVTAQPRPVSRDEAAAATGIKRPTAAFHLDRLVECGLLETLFARLSGRTGPGAGRTAKLYTRSRCQFDVSLPPRRYQVAGDIFASALVEVQRSSGPASDAVARAAERAGEQLAGGGTDLASALAGAGYEPRPAGCEIELANCPFHELAANHTELVCGLNLHLLRGLLAGLGCTARPRLTPAPGRCCVTISLR